MVGGLHGVTPHYALMMNADGTGADASVQAPFRSMLLSSIGSI